MLNHGKDQTDPLSHEADDEDDDVDDAVAMVARLLALLVFYHLAQMHPNRKQNESEGEHLHVVDGDADCDVREDAGHDCDHRHLVEAVVVERITEVDDARKDPQRHEHKYCVKST